MKLAIGSDHAGYELKSTLIEYLKELGHEVVDYGPDSENSVDYPKYAHPVASAVENGEYELAIIMCGSGNGINMTANKHQGVRSALCWNAEIAMMARAHNNANILALPARYIAVEEAKKCVDEFLNTPFEGGRHENRVNQIPCA